MYIYMYIYVSLSFSLSLYVYIYIYTYMYTYIYTYMCIYIYIHIHAYTHNTEPSVRAATSGVSTRAAQGRPTRLRADTKAVAVYAADCDFQQVALCI